jgi:hypothetical protein
MYQPTGFETRPGLMSCQLHANSEGARDSTWFFETRVVRLVNWIRREVPVGVVKFATFSLAAWWKERQEVLVMVEYPPRYTH